MNRQESLGQYVRRVLKEKNLSLSEVEQRAQGEISDSYICSITTGSAGSVTVAKLKALARGLDVPEDDIFEVARGLQERDDGEFQVSDFALLFRKFKDLAPEDKGEVQALLQVLKREIEWRQLRPQNRMRLVSAPKL